MISEKIIKNIYPNAAKEGLVEETAEHTIHYKKTAKNAKDIIYNMQKLKED